MSKTAARNLFIFGSLFMLVALIWLSLDSVKAIEARTPPVTGKVVEGLQVWQKHTCINCHTLIGNGAYFAPDLTKVYSRRGDAYLRAFLQNPPRPMPNFHLSGNDIDALIEFFRWVDGIDTNGWPPEPLIRK